MADALVVAAPRESRPPTVNGIRRRDRLGTGLGVGLATLYLSVLVLLPLAAVVWKSQENGWSAFWDAVTAPEAWSTIKLTVLSSLGVALINVVMGTLIAWVLVRDKFPGQRVLDTLIDLPFALPTIVAGIVLISLYGVQSPVHVTLAY